MLVCVNLDGVIGIGIATAGIGLIAGGLAAALSRKKWSNSSEITSVKRNLLCEHVCSSNSGTWSRCFLAGDAESSLFCVGENWNYDALGSSGLITVYMNFCFKINSHFSFHFVLGWFCLLTSEVAVGWTMDFPRYMLWIWKLELQFFFFFRVYLVSFYSPCSYNFHGNQIVIDFEETTTN